VQKLDYNKKNVGAALKVVRTGRGLKQSYVAQKAGISKELISKIENGKCDYRLCRVNQLLQIYRCPPLEFWNMFDYTGFLAIETCQPAAAAME
jgi:transcriptional regulator with XRE-family HTH domain